MRGTLVIERLREGHIHFFIGMIVEFGFFWRFCQIKLAQCMKYQASRPMGWLQRHWLLVVIQNDDFHLSMMFVFALFMNIDRIRKLFVLKIIDSSISLIKETLVGHWEVF